MVRTSHGPASCQARSTSARPFSRSTTRCSCHLDIASTSWETPTREVGIEPAAWRIQERRHQLRRLDDHPRISPRERQQGLRHGRRLQREHDQRQFLQHRRAGRQPWHQRHRDGVSDVTGGGGGYELSFATNSGAKAITFGLATGAPSGVSVSVGTTNIKVDVVNGRESVDQRQSRPSPRPTSPRYTPSGYSLADAGPAAPPAKTSSAIPGRQHARRRRRQRAFSMAVAGAGHHVRPSRLRHLCRRQCRRHRRRDRRRRRRHGASRRSRSASPTRPASSERSGTVDARRNRAGIGGAGTVLDNVLTGNAAGNRAEWPGRQRRHPAAGSASIR